MKTQTPATSTPLPDRAPTRGARMARRGLLTAAATAGLCGAAAVASPYVVPYVEERLKEAALDSALGELRQIEGVSIEAALRAAELTRIAVSVIVLPVARLVAVLGGDALSILLATLDTAHTALGFVHAPTTSLDALRMVVASWQAGVTALPIALDAYLNADITGAETYLRALRNMMQQHMSTTA